MKIASDHCTCKTALAIPGRFRETMSRDPKRCLPLSGALGPGCSLRQGLLHIQVVILNNIH